MERFIRLKKYLRESTFEQFESEFLHEIDSQYASLLLATVIDRSLSPFSSYLNLLLQRGAKLDYSGLENNTTLLMRAAMSSKPEIVEAIIEKGAQLALRDSQGLNALHHAIQHENEELALQIVQLILSHCPHLALLGAYSQGDYLTLSIRSQRPAVLRVLMERGVQPNKRIREGLCLEEELIRVFRKYRNKQKVLHLLGVLLSQGWRPEEQHSSKNEQQWQKLIQEAMAQLSLNKKTVDTVGQLINQQDQGNQLQVKIQFSSINKKETKLRDEDPELISDDSPEDQILQQQNQMNLMVFGLNHQCLSRKMVEFAQKCNLQHEKVWKQIQPFLTQLHSLAEQFYGIVQLIGSFATGLWMPFSDIDIMLIIQEKDPFIFEQMVQVFCSRIKTWGMHSNIRLIPVYKLPLIKVTLNKSNTGLEVELFLANKRNISSRYVAYTNQILYYNPEIKIIYCIIRKLLETAKLHDHKKGGLKAYALFLMVYQMRSHYSYQFLSQFVEHFAYYYGMAYEYPAEVTAEGIEWKINIVDPLNNQNNMGGKKTDVIALKELFRKVYYGINVANSEEPLQYLLELVRLD